MKRPFFILAVFFCIGILTGTHFPSAHIPFCYAAAAGALLLLPFRHVRVSHAGLYLLVLLCGCVLTQYHQQMYQLRSDVFAQTVGGDRGAEIREFRGVVAETPVVTVREEAPGAKKYYHRLLIHAAQVRSRGTWAGLPGNVMVGMMSASENPSCGRHDEIQFAGRAVPAGGEGAGLARKSLLMSKQVSGAVFVGGKQRIAVIGRTKGSAAARFVDHLRRRVLAALASGLPDTDARKLFIGMILGEQQGMSEAVKEVFRNTNTIHIVAISGQQVTLVSFIIIGILGAFFISRRVAALIAIPAIVLYAVIVGNEPSVFRSAIMMLVILSGWILSRESDIINSLSFAALVMLCLRPYDIYNVGFQLSFIVVFAIVVLTPALISACSALLRIKDERRSGSLTGKAIAGLAVCVSAWIGSAPLIAYYFHLFSPVSVLANIFTGVMVGFIIVPLGFASVVLGQLSLWLASACNAVNGLFSAVLIAGNTALSKIPYACCSVPAFSAFDAVLSYGVAAAFAQMNTMKKFSFTKKRFIFLLFALCVFVWAKCLGTFSGLEVRVLDVGQGDAIAVNFPNGKCMIVDGGPGYPQAPMRRSIRSYLSSRSVRHIDAVVVTHPHADHIGGLPAILDRVSVGEVITNGSAHPSFLYKKLLEQAEAKDIRYREARAGDTIDLDRDVKVEVLWPAGDLTRITDENDASIVLKISYGQTAVLLCADAGRGAFEKVLASGADVKADVIKIPHHGAQSSLDKEFLGRVSPRAAVISAGKNNKFGHPSPAVIDFLAATGIKIYRTDLNGTITVRVDKSGYKIKTAR
jgi:competence protein ComEC